MLWCSISVKIYKEYKESKKHGSFTENIKNSTETIFEETEINLRGLDLLHRDSKSTVLKMLQIQGKS